MAATRPALRRACAWPRRFLTPATCLVAPLALALLAGVRLSRFAVAGPSMEPALIDGDRLLVLRGPAWLLRPRTGQLVVARPRALDGREVVKRLHAIAGHGRAASYHLRGDNPPWSTDSRDFGPVGQAEITGRVLLRYWPDDRRVRVR
jgi:signal peptidase I